ncbi:radical SAM protein [Desulfosarcina cetonica]
MSVPSVDLLRQTKSVCPYCLKTLPAAIYQKNGKVYMHKRCPQHGEFDIYLWPDAARYISYGQLDFPAVPRKAQTRINQGCPQDCGLCPAHKRGITLPEIEVTWRCNLACPVCFMFDDQVPEDPTIPEIIRMYESIQKHDGYDLPIQITGGEPTVRRDLDEIIGWGRRLGFCAVELNTNGLVIGKDRDYLKRLKDSGLTNIYLQFDGLDEKSTIALRGRNLLAEKHQAIENCRQEGIPVVLSVAVVEGINDHELGDLISFAMHNLDVVCGLALQPAFVSGRFDVKDRHHLSVLDVAHLISRQTRGKIDASDFWPVSSSHPLCYGSTFLSGAGDDYEPLTRHISEDAYRQMFDPASPQGAVFKDIAAKSRPEAEPPGGLPILIMEYMDAWTMDLDRASQCNLAVTQLDGRSIPFCIYHLSDSKGRRLYPHGGRTTNAARS